jgi:hypothetical protein|tara:strand:+ start:1118 stop:1315 length:198 start_codon:yes stop_codon:yes gene_type:complete
MAKITEVMTEIDQLNIKFNHHEFKCEQNNEEIKFRLRRVEMILWTSSGTTILFLATLLTSILFNQ